MKKLLSLSFAILASALTSQAYEVKAAVVDNGGEPLPFVTYRVFTANDSLVVSNISDDLGIVAQSISRLGEYKITFSYVGMSDNTLSFSLSNENPIADLQQVTLADNSEVLHDVTVTAQKPLVVRQLDRIAYDVQADPERPTATASDILRKVPMVTVDADGTIRVNGSTNFKVYKNGRPNNSLSRNAKDILQALPAASIKRIEVITEPGAQFDAEGTAAILNIITEDNTEFKGVMGNVNMRYDAVADDYQPGGFIIGEIGKVNVQLYGGYVHSTRHNSANSTTTDYTFADGTNRINSDDVSFKYDLGYGGVELSWQPDTLNLFTTEFAGYTYNMRYFDHSEYSISDVNKNPLGFIASDIVNPKQGYTDFDGNFNFQHRTHRKGETYTLSYQIAHTNQNSLQRNTYLEQSGILESPYIGRNDDYSLDFFEHTFQFDYARQLGIHNLDVGLKSILRRNHSTTTSEYVGYITDHSDFKHSSDVYAAFGQYSVSLGKVSLRAGLRYEFTHLSAKYPNGSGDPFSSDLSDLVPSAAASWQINDGNSLSFNYSTSIQRPGISYLNPAVVISPVIWSYGNPDLESTRRQSAKITYMLIKPKFNLNFSTQYAFTNNAIADLNFVAEDYVTHSTYANSGRERELNFDIYARWSPFPKTSIMLNGAIAYKQYKQQSYSLSRWWQNIFLSVNQRLPWKFSIELGAFYNNNYVGSVYSYNSYNFMNAMYYFGSLSRSFLKQDRLTAKVQIVNMPGRSSKQFYDYTVNGDYTGTKVMRVHNQSKIVFTLSYRFGNISTQVKKTDHSIDNDDLIGRKK